METTKKIRDWNGLNIGISTPKGERRFPLSPPMKCDYGHIRKTWGVGEDGKAVDIYLAGESPTVHKIYQINPVTKRLDEHKYILGADNIDAAKKVYLDHVSPQYFGGIIAYDIERLKEDCKIKE